MKCPYCGKDPKFLPRVESNLDAYHKSVRARCNSCHMIVEVSVHHVYEVHKTEQSTRDSWGE